MLFMSDNVSAFPACVASWKTKLRPSLIFAWTESGAELATLCFVERTIDAATRRADCLATLHALGLHGLATAVLKSVSEGHMVHSADISQMSTWARLTEQQLQESVHGDEGQAKHQEAS